MPIVALHGENLDFKIGRDDGKISYECRVYESVDNKSLSSAIAQNLDRKINPSTNELHGS